MSYVDMMSDVRWTEADHVNRVETVVRLGTTHTREHVLTRRTLGFIFYILSQMLPAEHPAKALLASMGQPFSPAALAELMAAAQNFTQADILAVEARADSARLNLALDYEEARLALSLLPSVPEQGEDPLAQLRAYLEGVISSATEDTIELVTERDEWKAQSDPSA